MPLPHLRKFFIFHNNHPSSRQGIIMWYRLVASQWRKSKMWLPTLVVLHYGAQWQTELWRPLSPLTKLITYYTLFSTTCTCTLFSTTCRIMGVLSSRSTTIYVLQSRLDVELQVSRTAAEVYLCLLYSCHTLNVVRQHVVVEKQVGYISQSIHIFLQSTNVRL